MDPIAKELFDLLACPRCKSGLRYNQDKSKLICDKCKQEYEIKEGIPIFITKK